MLKAWLVGVGILFVLAEFGIWLKQFMLPLPTYIIGGAFLAIASNYEKGLIALFRQPDADPDVLTQTATLIKRADTLKSSSSQAVLPETATNQELIDRQIN